MRYLYYSRGNHFYTTTAYSPRVKIKIHVNCTYIILSLVFYAHPHRKPNSAQFIISLKRLLLLHDRYIFCMRYYVIFYYYYYYLS